MWGWLAFAIVCEVTATLCLRASDGFTRLGPSVVVVVGYGLAFFALSRSLVRGMEVGHAYAIWAGIGVGVVAAAGVALFGERLTMAQVVGIGLIISGVATVELGASH